MICMRLGGMLNKEMCVVKEKERVLKRVYKGKKKLKMDKKKWMI